MKGRLTKILEYYHLSSAQFAERIGVQRSSISHILSGRNKPSFDFIVKLLEHFNDLNSDWLLTGEGKMHKLGSNSVKPTDTGNLFMPKPELNTNLPDKQEFTGATNHKKEAIKPQETPISNTEITATKTKVTNVNKVKYMVMVYEDDSFEIINRR